MGAVLHKGREALRNNRSKGGDGPAPWEREITLRHNDMALSFVVLNELETDDLGEVLWQFYEHRWMEGTSAQGKPFRTHIPCGDPDTCLVKDEDGDHITKGLSYRWLTNLLVMSLTHGGKDVEINLGKDKKPVVADTPWGERKVEDRVFMLNQGGDTNEALLFQEEKDTRLMPKKGKRQGKTAYAAREYTLRRVQGAQRVEYSLHPGEMLYFRADGIFLGDDLVDDEGEKIAKPKPSFGKVDGIALIEEALEARHDLKEQLDGNIENGLIGCGFKKRPGGSSNGGGNNRPAANASDSDEPETADDDELADFDEVDLDELDGGDDDSGELV